MIYVLVKSFIASVRVKNIAKLFKDFSLELSIVAEH